MASIPWVRSGPVSEATLARATSYLLWALIVLAGIGGLGALVRTTATTPKADSGTQSSSAATTQSWVATGFAERYVTAYLLAGTDGGALASYLGYTPELPSHAQPAEIASPIRTVEITSAGEDYWAVTVAVGPPGQERFWRTAVDVSGDAPVAVGLPAAVAHASAAVERIDLRTTLGPPPVDDPAVDTVRGFLTAYLCGAGDLSRYLRPGLALTAATPAVCSELELTRWGATADGPLRQTVIVDALFSAGEGTPAWQGTYAAELARRDGRWEVAELLPAPPLKEGKDD